MHRKVVAMADAGLLKKFEEKLDIDSNIEWFDQDNVILKEIRMLSNWTTSKTEENPNSPSQTLYVAELYTLHSTETQSHCFRAGTLCDMTNPDSPALVNYPDAHVKVNEIDAEPERYAMEVKHLIDENLSHRTRMP